MATTRLIRILAEESRHFLHELHQSLLHSSQGRQLDPIRALDADAQAAERSAASQRYSEYLRTRLRKTPYWTRGHLLLGQEALRLNDVATSYACAKAAAVLAGPSAQSERLLAGCYLKRGAFQEASQILEKLASSVPNDYGLREDLAACFIGMEKFRQAREVLEAVPEESISAPGKAALLYARKKTEPEA